MFHVGQMVVCVDDEWTDLDCRPCLWAEDPRKGLIYEIARIEGTWLYLQEIANGIGYESCAFRPVVKTDISVFTAMLTPSPRRVKKLVAITTSQRAGKGEPNA